MNIFLAGAITGNLIKEWQNYMQLYLAQVSSYKTLLMSNFNEKEMKLYLAGPLINKDLTLNNPLYKGDIYLKDLFVLESFYYIYNQEWMFPLFKEFKGFLLDSGAFTFMSAKKTHDINWDEYVINYGKFIKTHNIKYFFELDIDVIVGLKEVERLRTLLEETAGRKCIPVWHKARGLDYWKQMVKDYDYVAIGGLVTQEVKRSEYSIFHPLLKLAKENNCKVHGLGFTNLKGMETYRFNSVDSTSWLSGNKFGAVYLFNGKTMTKKVKPVGKRVLTHKVAIHNFKEWVKFARYAENNL
jgi:hypothetical protein